MKHEELVKRLEELEKQNMDALKWIVHERDDILKNHAGRLEELEEFWKNHMEWHRKIEDRLEELERLLPKPSGQTEPMRTSEGYLNNQADAQSSVGNNSFCEAQRPLDRKTFCQKESNHKGECRAVIFWQDKPQNSSDVYAINQAYKDGKLAGLKEAVKYASCWKGCEHCQCIEEDIKKLIAELEKEIK